MEVRQDAQKIKLDKNLSAKIEKYGENIKVIVKEYFKKEKNQIYVNSEIGNLEGQEIWAKISEKEFGENISTNIKRTEIINKIVNLLLEKDIKGIYIDFEEIKNYTNFKRFVIEMVPKLREVGITTSIKLNKNIKKAEFVNIVDYII